MPHDTGMRVAMQKRLDTMMPEPKMHEKIAKQALQRTIPRQHMMKRSQMAKAMAKGY